MKIRADFGAALLAVVLGALPSATLAGQAACLTGDSAATDRAAIVAVESAASASCECDSFDGSDGYEAADYRRCVSGVVRTAVQDDALRSKCKGLVKKAFKASTCGQPDGTAPCIESDADGDVRCRIRTEDSCVDVPGRFTRRACPDAVRCVDAADDNADWRVDSGDSGECRPPSTTSTTTTTSTLEPDTTTTLEPTTTTLSPDTTTTTLEIEPSTTTLPDETTTTTLVEETTSTTTTSTTTSTTLPCGLSQPTPVVVWQTGYPEDDDVPVIVPPDPAANNCAPQSQNGGGCGIDPKDAIEANYFDASQSFVPDACPGTTLSFRWQHFFSPSVSSASYASLGISGYYTPRLTILPNSLPSIIDTGDRYWRVKLTITANQGANPTREVFFRYEYQQSSLTLEAWSNCQADPESCDPMYHNGLPTSEPH
jgi:hypothetical protein